MKICAIAAIIAALAGTVCRAQSSFDAQVVGALETTHRQSAGQRALTEFPVRPGYDADSALNKREYIYGRVAASSYASLPPLSEGFLLGAKGSKILTHAQDFFAGSRNDFRADLAGLDPETKIYEIWATSGKGGSAAHIGSLVTKSRFTASAYGDQVLFFKHNAEFKK